MTEPIANRYDFVLLFDVTDGKIGRASWRERV